MSYNCVSLCLSETGKNCCCVTHVHTYSFNLYLIKHRQIIITHNVLLSDAVVSFVCDSAGGKYSCECFHRKFTLHPGALKFYKCNHIILQRKTQCFIFLDSHTACISFNLCDSQSTKNVLCQFKLEEVFWIEGETSSRTMKRKFSCLDISLRRFP